MHRTPRQIFENLCVTWGLQEKNSARAKDVGSTRLARVGPTAVLMGARHAIWISAFIPACFHPSYDHPTCGPNGECPSGLFCSTQLICEDGANATDDAGTNPMIDGLPDALVCYGTGIVKVCFASAPTQPLSISDQTLDTGTPTMCATTVTGGDNYCVVVATTITISGTLRATGPKPLVLIGSDSITTTNGSLIDVGSHRVRNTGVPETGAGADDMTCPPGMPATSRGGGAGGSFTGTGGIGGNGAIANTGTPAGAATPPIATLRGGCPGGDGNGTTGSAGHGGGAIYLIAGTKISIGGNGINAGGEAGGGGTAGPSGGGGGGGGAGGMIGFDAPMIMVIGLASLVANGGGGGEGGGGGNTNAGVDGTDALTTGAARGGTGGTGSGGDGGNGSAGMAAGTGMGGSPGTSAGGINGGGGGGGGGAGIIKGPAAMLGGNVSPAATP